jgi:hypothetical protein
MSIIPAWFDFLKRRRQVMSGRGSWLPFFRLFASICLLSFSESALAAKDVDSVTVGAQSGTVTYGTAGSVTYTVSFTSDGNGNGNCSLTVTGLPTGVAAGFSGGTTVNFSNATPSPAKTLTLTTDAATTPAVTNDAFTVTCTKGARSRSGDGRLTVNPRAITITPTAGQNKIYGDADPVLTFTNSPALVNGDTFSGAISRAAGANVGSYTYTIGTLSAGTNYSLTLAAGTFAITARAITVTAGANSKNFGAADPALTFAITSGSLVGADTFSGALSRVAGESPGTYTITQGTLALSANYTLAYVSANLTIGSGSFNAFETSTVALAVTGNIFTKLVGTGFGLDVVAIGGGVQGTSFADNVRVELLANTGVPAAGYGADNCPTSNAVIQTIASAAIAGGRSTVNFAAVANAYRDVRVRISYPIAASAVINCSSDSFSIRPSVFTVTSTDATNTGSAGTPVIRTGANFNLTAASVPGYDGTPSIDNAKVAGSPNAGSIGGSFNAALVATGTASAAAFYYSEVGNFGLNANAVFDSSFTSIDISGIDCDASFSNVLAGGRYGCSIGSTAVAQTTGTSGFGRFIPDNFSVTYNTPSLGSACGTFTYVGQQLNYTTQPIITVTARNGTSNGLTNATTTNYAGAYAKLNNSSLAPNTQAARYSRFDALAPPLGNTPALDTTGLPAIASDPAINPFVNGVTTLTFNSGTGLLFARGTTAKAPFDADIALAVNVIDTDTVAYAGNPAQFGAAFAGNGIAFGGGNKAIRFGRLKLSNAYGSELLNLPVPIGTEYWSGTSFVPNIQDSCTSIAAGNVTLGGYLGGITAANMTGTNVSIGGAFSSGKGRLALTKPLPRPTTKGSVNITIDLVTESKTYLSTGPTFSSDPIARATFGVNKRGPIIYLREMY